MIRFYLNLHSYTRLNNEIWPEEGDVLQTGCACITVRIQYRLVNGMHLLAGGGALAVSDSPFVKIVTNNVTHWWVISYLGATHFHVHFTFCTFVIV